MAWRVTFEPSDSAVALSAGDGDALEGQEFGGGFLDFLQGGSPSP